MTAIEDRPNLEERYSRAIESSHLEVLADERCSVDMLIAAGWVKEGLGTALYRLRSEYDSVRGAHVLARRELSELQTRIDRLNRAAREEQDYSKRPALALAVKLGVEELKRAELTERVLILAQLKSLPDTKRSMGRFAIAMATRSRFMENDRVVTNIAGACLSLWLDPLCPQCNGTGLAGGVGVVKGICSACGGSKTRPYQLDKTAAGHDFGRSLLVLMDKKTDYVTSQMRRYLASR